MRIELYGYTDIGSRRENEDASVWEQPGEDRFYAAVADGLGGHAGGKQAAQLAIRTVSGFFRGVSHLPSPGQLEACLTAANREILAGGQNRNQMKTTIVVLCVCGGQAIWSHAGDSRLYHYCNGELVDYTCDHSVSQISVQLGEISREQIPSHPGRSRLLQVLGSEDLRPETAGPVELAPGHHAFLLCSDGFWEYLREDELLFDLSKSGTPKQWIDCLRWRGDKRRRASVDNHTAIAAFLEVP